MTTAVTYHPDAVSPTVVFDGEVSSSSAPTYISDPAFGDRYTVSVVAGWSTAETPTTCQIWIWQKRANVDTVVGVIYLIGANAEDQTVEVVTGQSVSIDIPGRTPFISATVYMAGGSTPTFTGTVLFQGYVDAEG